MEIKKGTIVKINCSRKGEYIARVTEDFDTIKDTFYPVELAQVKTIQGLNTFWEMGDSIPCRGSFCKIEIIEKPANFS